MAWWDGAFEITDEELAGKYPVAITSDLRSSDDGSKMALICRFTNDDYRFSLADPHVEKEGQTLFYNVFTGDDARAARKFINRFIATGHGINGNERILPIAEEPDIDLNVGCRDPYQCAFWPYCSRHLPERSVFNIYRLAYKKKLEYYYKGWITYRELLENAPIKNEKQIRQMLFGVEDRGTYIDRDAIAVFLRKLSYPLYFLDFETMLPAIPKYVGTHPYTQIPFQYSLHYIEQEGGELKHKEFLAESGTDPRQALAEQLCRDIPKNVCVTAYNKSFECSRIRELAAMYKYVPISK